MKKIDIRHFSHLEKLATLTHLYLELRLSLAEALRAAKADLQMDSLPYATQQVLKQHAFLGSSAAAMSTQGCLGKTYDGRMDFGATTTTVVEDLTGRKPLTLREWVVRYRDSVLAVGAQAAEGSLKE